MTDNTEHIAATRQALQALQVQRKSLEAESDVIQIELTQSIDGVPPMGIDTPLVDQEGYPRGDVDVYRARALRGRLAEIQTDYKVIMKQVEDYLSQLAFLQNSNKVEESKAEFASRMAPKPKPKYDPSTGKWVCRNWDGSVAGAGTTQEERSFDSLSATAAPAAAVLPPAAQADLIPFARVNSVAPDSPAYTAGLVENDLILSFGNITLYSGDPLAEVGRMVPVVAGQEQSLTVLVQRQGGSESLQLTPKPWSGRGLLGCHIVPHTA
jgi:26S proteasome non-ATPase regulatory subunit 9